MCFRSYHVVVTIVTACHNNNKDPSHKRSESDPLVLVPLLGADLI